MAHPTATEEQAYQPLQGDGAGAASLPASARMLLGDAQLPDLPEGFPPRRRGCWPLLVACVPCLGSWRGLVSRAALGWLSPTVWRAFRGEPADTSAFVNEPQSGLIDSLRLMQLLHTYTSRSTATGGAGRLVAGASEQHLARAMWAFTRGRLIVACALGVVGAIGSVASSVLLVGGLVNAMDDSGQVPAVLWAFAFALCELLTCLLAAGSSSIATRHAGRLRAAIQCLLYRKVLRINSCSDLQAFQTEAVVLTTGTPLWRAAEHAPKLVIAPVLVLLSMSAACVLIGETAIVACAVYLFAATVQTVGVGLVTRLRARAHAVYSRWHGQRTFELLSLAAHAKAFMVESALIRRLRELRRAEAISLRLASTLNHLCRRMMPAATTITVALTLHPTFVEDRKRHPAATLLYPVLILIMVQMETALRSWGQAAHAFLEARNCLGELKEVLYLDEAKVYPGQPIDRLVALSINTASFSWFSADAPGTAHTGQPGDLRRDPGQLPNVLTGIHLVVNKGQLVGVCGRPGSGKTSLLLAACGQLHLTAGQLHRDESAAYVGPQCTLLPGSVRENVTIGAALSSQRYYRALHCTGLDRDIQAMATGDKTLVDSSRMAPALMQRLALARAIYADREVYLLDDPLSALDSASADLIFESAILGALKNKTVILVTNREQHLRHCHGVYVMREGRVLERDAPAVLAESGREFPQVIDSHNREEQWWVPPLSSEVVRAAEMSRDSDAEDVAGSGAWSELRALAADCGTAPSRLAVLAVPMLLQSAMYATMLLCFWLAMQEPRPPYLGVGFVVSAALVVSFSFVRIFIMAPSLLNQSRRLHNHWLERVGCATVDFLRAHAAPLQHALDTHTRLVDGGVARGVAGVANWTLLVVADLVLLVLTSSWVTAAVLILLLPGALVLAYIACTVGVRMWQRERQCQDSMRQLVAASFASRIAVLSLGREDDMVARFAATCDQGASDLVHAQSLPAWLAVRIRAAAIAGGLITLGAQIWTTAVEVPLPAQDVHHGAMPDDRSPLSSSGADIGMTVLLLCLITTHLTRAAVAAVRARSHIAAAAKARDLVHRAEVEDESLSVKSSASYDDPNLNWPSLTDAGGLMLRDVWRPPELRALTTRVPLGECMGVLGASSGVLGPALLRFIRPSAGCILVSGADIADIPLPLLRSAVVVVPARPTVFQGTLRWNLDPHGVWSDAQLWDALERTGLRDLVASLSRKLLMPLNVHSPLSAESEDVQLMCLARAALRDWAKVVLLEAPAGPRVLAAARKLFPNSAVVVAGRSAADVAQCGSVLQAP